MVSTKNSKIYQILVFFASKCYVDGKFYERERVHKPTCKMIQMIFIKSGMTEWWINGKIIEKFALNKGSTYLHIGEQT